MSNLNRPVLVLNKNYLPVEIKTVKSTVGKILTNKVVVIENAVHEFIKTSSFDFPVPKVVLNKHPKVRRKRIRFTKLNVMMRDGYICAYCGKKFKTSQLNIDHVVPKSKWHSLDDHHKVGKGDSKSNWLNVVTSCNKCNTRKGDRLLEELGWSLKFEPKKPESSHILLHIKRDTIERYGWTDYCGNAFTVKILD